MNKTTSSSIYISVMHVAPHISRTAGRMTGLQKPSLLLLGVFGVCLGCLHSSSGKVSNSNAKSWHMYTSRVQTDTIHFCWDYLI